MEKNNISNMILKKMNQEEKNTIFTINDFYDLGSKSAIKTAIFRLLKSGEIYRLIDGYYTIPYYSEFIQEYSYPSADALAKKIAEKYIWNISPFGENALNQVGLSTQVPAICEYISDGPYREYQYRNKVIKFKHTSNRNISSYSLSLSLIIQSIKAIGKDKITKKDIKIMSIFCKKYVEEDLIKDTKSVPSWIYEILRNIKEEIDIDK